MSRTYQTYFEDMKELPEFLYRDTYSGPRLEVAVKVGTNINTLQTTSVQFKRVYYEYMFKAGEPPNVAYAYRRGVR